MSANPLEQDPEREHRIRDRAYHLWVDEGRPHGRHDEFWERASELIGMEDSAGSGQLPNPLTTGANPSLSEPIEEAALQENLGDFPDRLNDENEGSSTPKASRARASVAAERASARPKTAKPAPETLPAKPSLKKAAENQASKNAPEPAKKRAPKH